MIRRRAVATLLATCSATIMLGAPPVLAQPAPPPPPPVHTPDTSGCPYRIAPAPAVDLSEVPAPGTTAPKPLTLPDEPVGGPQMGECGLVLPDGAPPPPPGIDATSWLLADADSGAVLAAKDAHGRHRPASILKLFTALLAAEQLPLDRVVTATQVDADQEGSSVGLGPGGKYTVRQLLTGLLLVSGNDAAHALSVQLGGVPQTVTKMNDLAEQLGALDTRAATPSGLDGPGMSTSAYDMALVFRQVLGNPVLVQLLGTRQVNFPGFPNHPGFVLASDNKLLRHYPGALGGKTGFTDDARHTQIDAAQRGGRRLIVVLMQGEQHPVPMWQQAAHLLDYGFTLPSSSSVGRLVDGPPAPPEGETAVTAPVRPHAGTAAVAARHDQSPAQGPDQVVVALLWIAGAAVVLGVLAALVARQRGRSDSRH
jgi:D-alanyl-D-alanine carboxypeptidase (penicillin-binding protein 5/6)